MNQTAGTQELCGAFQARDRIEQVFEGVGEGDHAERFGLDRSVLDVALVDVQLEIGADPLGISAGGLVVFSIRPSDRSRRPRAQVLPVCRASRRAYLRRRTRPPAAVNVPRISSSLAGFG